MIKFKNIEQNIDFVKQEEFITQFWQENNIFFKSIQNREDSEEQIFYDGPPFPTGSPHHGTVFVSILKDCLARFYTMIGKKVPRVWGWDCHGLPIENAVEKELGITTKTQIEDEFGVKVFNDACRKLVYNFNDAWEDYITRVGRWVDFKNPYRTLDKNYMESVIWVFAESYKKGLIYKDFRVTPYCYRCETSLSISDTRESDSMREKQDPAIIIKIASKKSIDNKRTYFLAWTTTPWTLVGNQALAVHKDVEYSVVDVEGEYWILAKNLVDKYQNLLKVEMREVKSFPGKDLEGWHYEPVFPYYKGLEEKGHFKVILADFVTVSDGVGIVHIAPAFGEDDYWACRNYNFSPVNPVDKSGCYIDEITEFAGRNVHEANADIISTLKLKGAVVDHRTINHNYPHCWRCRQPLIYYAMDAWYYDIEKIKDKLLIHNQEINWVPDTVKNGRFGKWLEDSRNWNISRNRYWGTPLPIWECDNENCNERWVASSCKELSEKAGYKINDLHKEFLDEIKFECSCGGTMIRVPEVLDCWFESGSMPFAQCHYPFENKDWFHEHFPADYIVEYTGQLRGWFYYLHVLAVALMDKPSFKYCLVHGTFLAADGAKMSKSLKNYTDPMILLKKYSADAFRTYVLSSSATVMADLQFRDEDIDKNLKTVIIPLWNSYYFFVTYANVDGYLGNPDLVPSTDNELDLWIISRLYYLEKIVRQAFETYYLNIYFKPIKEFIDDLTNWYIRRNRNRIWEKGLSKDKKNCYDTLYYVLINLAKIIAPSIPFVSEAIYQNLTNQDSVHLSDWPDIPDYFANKDLETKVGVAQKITSLGLSLRKMLKIKVRQPLQKIRIVLPQNIKPEILDGQLSVIESELNVKQVEFTENVESFATIIAKVNARKLGAVYGKEIQLIIRAAKEGNIIINNGKAIIKGENKEWELCSEDIEVGYKGHDENNVASDGGIVVSLDTHISNELLEEGTCNEITRHIQMLRKESGFQMFDRIFLQIDGSLPEVSKNKIAEATLGEIKEIVDSDTVTEVTVNQKTYSIKIVKQ